jgi:hypothetical protein
VKTKIMLALSLILLAAVTIGYGQPVHKSSIKVKIDFPFTVNGKALPAGVYEFVREERMEVFRVAGEGDSNTLAPILTRIAGEMHATPQDAHLVFDVIGDTNFLSEIWIPGDDGYVMLAPKDKHGHRVINVKY